MEKKALITGVARGIGKAITERFITEGYVVHGTFFTSEAQARELELKFGSEKLILHGPYDFQDTSQTQSLINELSTQRFDVIIPCAGRFSENDDFVNFDLDEFNGIMSCNFYAPLMICLGLQHNINDNGSIIIMSSNDAYPGAYSSLSYSISKSALISLMKCLCVNFGSRGIRVNSVAPGAINTDMNTPEQEFEAPLYTPVGRIGQPSEVADAVWYLASTGSSFINGENISIDGGYNVVSVLLKNEAERVRAE